MKAAVWRGPRRPALEELPFPRPADGEVLVRTRVVGICGTDLEVFAGRFPSGRAAECVQSCGSRSTRPRPDAGKEDAGKAIRAATGDRGVELAIEAS